MYSSFLFKTQEKKFFTNLSSFSNKYLSKIFTPKKKNSFLFYEYSFHPHTKSLIMKKILIPLIGLLLSILVNILYTWMPAYTDFTHSKNPHVRLWAASRLLNETKTPDYFIYDKPEMASISRKGYCGVKFVDGTLDYYMRNFQTESEAAQAGYVITHKEKCGICTDLRVLAAWTEHPDLSNPVRRCAALNWIPGYFMECLKRIGFT